MEYPVIPSDIRIRYVRRITHDDQAATCVRFMPVATFATGSEDPANPPGPGVPGSGPGGSGSASAGGPPDPVNEIGVALYGWVVDVRDLLESLQKTLERAHDDASPEQRRELSELLVRLRHCRANVPAPDMIRAWLRFLIASAR